ncbi:MAG: diguanylate cyclase domain-containing protein [Elainellaceae cyanobacterium]
MDAYANDQSSPLTILLADDDRFTRQLLISQLTQTSEYRVIDVDNGKACLEAYHEVNPNIVLLDASMPTMDGFECCQQLRSLRPTESLPILMITGLDDCASVDRAFEAGATDYVTKPIHWAVLRQRVRLYIERCQLYQALEAANKRLKKLVALDGLTQIPNRRRFDETLQQEWRRLARESLPLSLALFDVDFFKKYNDVYGHLAGDHCLRQVAAVAQQSLHRPADLAARYGGEEFALLLPNTGEAGAVAIAQQLCHMVSALAIPHQASDVSPYVSVSVGVACMIPRPDQSADLLIEAADTALYQAKNFGRDQVIAHSQELAQSGV